MNRSRCALILAGALALTGCAAEPAPIVPTADATVDERFVATIREKIPQYEDRTDEALVERGREICTSLQAGAVELAVLNELHAEGWSWPTAMIYRSTQAYCPEHAD